MVAYLYDYYVSWRDGGRIIEKGCRTLDEAFSEFADKVRQDGLKAVNLRKRDSWWQSEEKK